MNDLQRQAKEAADGFVELWYIANGYADLPKTYKKVLDIVRMIERGELVEVVKE